MKKQYIIEAVVPQPDGKNYFGGCHGWSGHSVLRVAKREDAKRFSPNGEVSEPGVQRLPNSK